MGVLRRLRDLLDPRGRRRVDAEPTQATDPAAAGGPLSERLSIDGFVREDVPSASGGEFDLSRPTVRAGAAAQPTCDLGFSAGATPREPPGFTPAEVEALLADFAGYLDRRSFPPDYLRSLRADWDL